MISGKRILKSHKSSILLGVGVLFLLLAVGCRKVRNHPVPSIPFSISVNMSLPSYNALQGVGGWAYVEGGSRGIIVYRRSIDELVAFDRHSPIDNDQNCTDPLEVNANNFLELDDVCTNGKFSLYDGSPISNSEFGLRQYQVTWDGGFVLQVFN